MYAYHMSTPGSYFLAPYSNSGALYHLLASYMYNES